MIFVTLIISQILYLQVIFSNFIKILPSYDFRLKKLNNYFIELNNFIDFSLLSERWIVE